MTFFIAFLNLKCIASNSGISISVSSSDIIFLICSIHSGEFILYAILILFKYSLSNLFKLLTNDAVGLFTWIFNVLLLIILLSLFWILFVILLIMVVCDVVHGIFLFKCLSKWYWSLKLCLQLLH